MHEKFYKCITAKRNYTGWAVGWFRGLCKLIVWVNLAVQVGWGQGPIVGNNGRTNVEEKEKQELTKVNVSVICAKYNSTPLLFFR